MNYSIFQYYLTIDLGPVNLENWLSLPENWLPQLIVLLKDVFERGVLIGRLAWIRVVRLVLRVA